MSLKIYTKAGDQGKTSLLGGKKVSKSHFRIDAYGNVDELNAFIGLLKDQQEIESRLKQQLYWIQEHLFTIGSLLASESDFSGFELPKISAAEVKQLEVWIDKYSGELPELKNFILPGGHPVVSLCHVCRTVCRRTERAIEALNVEEAVDELIIQFINRLSDYFFIFARKLGSELKVKEVPWTPK